jgi:bifunctional UDP-N-acetylglucosamine pyrophosphorylase/glucosamine-1-phosphate N-acetyltransferase
MSQPLGVVILAAGKGTRMKSDLPKVLHPLAHRPLLAHVLAAATPLHPAALVTVIGHGAETVRDTIAPLAPANHTFAMQAEQLGTGHAVQQAKAALGALVDDATAAVLILSGDVPLVTAALLQGLLAAHQADRATVTVLSTHVPDPTGLGRIVRDTAGSFVGIVEHKDASPAERAIAEINTGIYVVQAKALFQLLADVKNTNSQNEYYLTDILGLAVARGLKAHVHTTDLGATLLGINTREQLAFCEGIWQQAKRRDVMLNGATLLDPATTYFSTDTAIGREVTIGPNTQFLPGVHVADGVTLEGNTVLANTTLERGAVVHPFCHLEGALLKAGASVGPFARLRPGSVLGEEAKVGNFVEIKKTTLGKGAKASHLTYLGDSTVGPGANIGAGTITCNYDGVNKHHTTIGEGAFIGSNSSLVAPVSVGAYATVGAGSTITRDVPPDTLALTRSEQITKLGYKRPVKKGA